MNRNRTISVVFAAITSAALGAGIAQALPAAPASTAARSAPKYVGPNCNDKPVTKPASWTPYCADYGVVLKHMHWTSWTSHLASGYGTVYEDHNYPDHADGKVYKVPALVTLWGS